MSQADLEINRDIRKVLIRHWIDLGKVSFRSANGRVWVRGAMQRIAGVREELTSALMDIMFNDLKRIRGVSSVNAELDNWTNALGKWHPLDKGKGKAAPGQERATGSVQVIRDASE